MLAWLVVAKFARHLPVYRHQEMLLGPLKLWLSRHPLVRAAAGDGRGAATSGSAYPRVRSGQRPSAGR